jgi:hypothetical protein
MAKVERAWEQANQAAPTIPIPIPGVSKVSAEVMASPNGGFVRFFVYSATGLMGKENGVSTPYCTINMRDIRSGTRIKTSVKKETTSPLWDESFVFAVPDMDKWAVRVDILNHHTVRHESLGHVYVIGTREKMPRHKCTVLEGLGELVVGWVVNKEPPVVEEDATSELSTVMPPQREGRLRVHITSAARVQRSRKDPTPPPALLVRVAGGLPGASESLVARLANETWTWKPDCWLEVNVPDLAAWSVVLELLERAEGQADVMIGSVALQAEKFNLGGSADYKTLPVSGTAGELGVGVAPAKQSKRLAMQIQRCVFCWI